MPLLSTDNQQDQDDSGVEILSQVSLKFFKAEPANIGPFGASLLSWEVEGPPGFQVKLSGLKVAKTGEKAVQPASMTTFNLTATARQASRTLGHVTVNVDTTGCETYEPLVNPKQTLEAVLISFVESNPDVRFRLVASGIGQVPSPLLPVVTFSPGKISFSLRLKKHVEEFYFPDPSVDIDASFGLTVSDGTLVAIGAQVSADVSVPFWAWALPGAIPALAIDLDGGRADARKAGHNAVEGLVQIINFSTIAPQGKRLRTVRIDEGNNGAGIIEVTACPYDLLRQYAAISGSVVIE